METELENLRCENSMLKEKFKKKMHTNPNKLKDGEKIIERSMLLKKRENLKNGKSSYVCWELAGLWTSLGLPFLPAF